MRIAVGQLWQETNTFNRNLTTLADFQNWGIAMGTDVLQKFGETGELGGFVSGPGSARVIRDRRLGEKHEANPFVAIYDAELVSLELFALSPIPEIMFGQPIHPRPLDAPR